MGKNRQELYYNLAEPESRCIKLTVQTWEIVENSVLFFRFNQKPQGEPDRNYHVDIFDNILI